MHVAKLIQHERCRLGEGATGSFARVIPRDFEKKTPKYRPYAVAWITVACFTSYRAARSVSLNPLPPTFLTQVRIVIPDNGSVNVESEGKLGRIIRRTGQSDEHGPEAD